MTTVLESLNQALLRALSDDERVIVLGEDILDPYGGAFKVTRGLSSRFPGRVLTTPISEAALVGTAAGMALRRLRPVVEIMFGDFLTLAADQLINHAAKYRWMYNDQVSVPMVVRAPMGGRRGYGPTHSQSLEKLFLGVPGLTVLAPCAMGDPGALLYSAILGQDNPVLFVENKLLYLVPVAADEAALPDLTLCTTGIPTTPTYSMAVRGAPPPSLTLVAYGHMAELARQALLRLAYEAEIFAELVVPTCLSPLDLQPILESVDRTGRLLVAEEGSRSLGFGAEALAACAEAAGPGLKRSARVAALDLPVPASGALEVMLLPVVEDIIQAAKKMV